MGSLRLEGRMGSLRLEGRMGSLRLEMQGWFERLVQMGMSFAVASIAPSAAGPDSRNRLYPAEGVCDI